MDSATLEKASLDQRPALVRFTCALVIGLSAGLCTVAQAQLPAERSCLPSSAGSASLQQQIETQRRRLSSSDVEERRCAVMSLGWMNRADSSRAAAAALSDSAAIVRATAARAVLSIPSDEAVAALLPLLKDSDEFVRQETAYSLGETRNRMATSALLTVLDSEKRDSVRGAAVVALGLIGDEAAVLPLSEILNVRVRASGLVNKVRRKKRNENEFIRRSAARALGQIGSRAAVQSLITALRDKRAPDDVRREAAYSLGLIGDQTAVAPLQAAMNARDPYLSRIASEALDKIARAEAKRPT